MIHVVTVYTAVSVSVVCIKCVEVVALLFVVNVFVQTEFNLS